LIKIGDLVCIRNNYGEPVLKKWGVVIGAKYVTSRQILYAIQDCVL